MTSSSGEQPGMVDGVASDCRCLSGEVPKSEPCGICRLLEEAGKKLVDLPPATWRTASELSAMSVKAMSERTRDPWANQPDVGPYPEEGDPDASVKREMTAVVTRLMARAWDEGYAAADCDPHDGNPYRKDDDHG